jgi:hypothetical protein
MTASWVASQYSHWMWIGETADESHPLWDSNPQSLDLESNALHLDHCSSVIVILGKKRAKWDNLGSQSEITSGSGWKCELKKPCLWPCWATVKYGEYMAVVINQIQIYTSEISFISFLLQCVCNVDFARHCCLCMQWIPYVLRSVNI